jgi:ribonuclease P protein component
VGATPVHWVNPTWSGDDHRALLAALQDGPSQFAPKTSAAFQVADLSTRRPIGPDRILAPEPGHEADLPTEEAKARPDTRLPGSDAHARWTLDLEAPAPQGPQAPGALRMAAGKRRRLSRSGEFDRVYREGSSHANRFLVVYRFPRSEDDDELRLGVSVGRKVGGAVERNRIKRALREAFWSLEEELPPGHDFVLVARSEIVSLWEREGAEGVRASLREALGATSERDRLS